MKLFDGGCDFFTKRFFLLKVLVGCFVFGLGFFEDSQDLQVFFSVAIRLFGSAFDCVLGGCGVLFECDFLEGFVVPA